MNIGTSDIFLAFMVVARAGAMLALIPMFGGTMIPRQIQLALAGGLAVLVYPLFYDKVTVPVHFLGLFLATINEVLIGFIMGLGIRMVFFVAEFAGSIIATESGLMRSDVFDPLMRSHSTTVSTLLFFLVGVLFMALGIHYKVIEVFVYSYEKAPIAQALREIKGVETLVRATANVFVLGLKMSAPILALSFVINMTFSVLGKAVPKMNVFIVSFSVRILAGFSLLFVTFGLIVQYFHGALEKIPRLMIELLTF